MQDRVPANPGRVLVTPENGGAAYYATLTRADNPTQEGTPLNKANLLSDATAALFGLGTNAVPNDAFAAIKRLIDNNSLAIANSVKIATGSYNGTGTYGSANKNTLTFGFEARWVFIIEEFRDLNTSAFSEYMQLINPLAAAVMESSSANNPGSKTNVTWSDTGVSWYSSEGVIGQQNRSGYVYRYIAIG